MSYSVVWNSSDPVGSDPANQIATYIQLGTKTALEERLDDLFGIADFTADPLVPTSIPFNRTAHPTILGGTTDFAFMDQTNTDQNVVITDAGGVTARAGLNSATLSVAYSPLNNTAWSNATAYTVGNIVSESGVNYICILNNTNQSPPNATYWTPLTGFTLSSTSANLFQLTSNVLGTPSLTITSAGTINAIGSLVATTAGIVVNKFVPTTAFSFYDTTATNVNLSIGNTGVVTVRTTLTVTGNISTTGSNGS